MSEASPRPWRVCGAASGNCQCGFIWSGETLLMLAAKDEADVVPDNDTAATNARLVVAAVNHYPTLLAAAQAVVENGGYGAFVTDWTGTETRFNLVPAHLYDALRAVVEESPE